jgi:hypothetical protein
MNTINIVNPNYGGQGDRYFAPICFKCKSKIIPFKNRYKGFYLPLKDKIQEENLLKSLPVSVL